MEQSRFSLQGKTALVTGASRGIGAAIALALAEAGADVAVCARSTAALEAVAERVRSAGRRSLVLTCDVTRAEEVAVSVERAWSCLGGLDVLVNNAGGPVFQAPFLEVREAGWASVVDLNLTSVFRLCQAVGGRMVARGSGSIVNIATVVPTRAWPSIAPYSAAKAGVLSLTQALAVEWGHAGVRVNAVCPGWIRTELQQPYLADSALAAKAIESVPLQRWGEVEDIVGPVLWLASAASSYVTGAWIPVDGGQAVGMPRDWLQAMALGTSTNRWQPA